ncbi:glycerate kinase [Ottowia sp. VDI28]|uniref:glycerate kinase n=1 Tax=Ottowia sp. VDI28 TaxID=3133968 RepID=UPI003C2B4FD4
MTWQRILTLVAAIALGAAAWRAGGWSGIAFLVSGVVLWFLLNYTRMITVMKRASDRPIGYVGSAVMLNTKLRPKLPLLHVIALTRSLGQRKSPEGEDPEIYVWRDPGDAQVTCEFVGGRLVRWHFERPSEAVAETGQA